MFCSGDSRKWKGPSACRPSLTPAIFMAVTLFMAVYAFKQWRTPSLWSVGSILWASRSTTSGVCPSSVDAMGQTRRSVN